MTPREVFFEEHGDNVRVNHFFLFEDGAFCEDSEYGVMAGPPTNEYELAKTLAAYQQVIAERAAQDFEDYKEYLNGTGFRKDAWAQLYTDEEQLEFLRDLQMTAKKAAAKYARKKRQAELLMPDELREVEEADIQESSRQHAFKEAVDSIQL